MGSSPFPCTFYCFITIDFNSTKIKILFQITIEIGRDDRDDKKYEITTYIFRINK